VLTIVFAWLNTRKIKRSIAKLKLEQGDMLTNLVQVNEYLKYLCQAKEYELNSLKSSVREEQPRPVNPPVITPEPPAPQPAFEPIPQPAPEPVPQTVPEPLTVPEQQPIIDEEETQAITE
jgi:hypothetical protein